MLQIETHADQKLETLQDILTLMKSFQKILMMGAMVRVRMRMRVRVRVRVRVRMTSNKNFA